MSMFCYQCQEAAGNTGCKIKGVCGKPEGTSKIQDLLIYNLKGIAVYGEELYKKGELDNATGRFVMEALFATITNANFDDERLKDLVRTALAVKKNLAAKAGLTGELHPSASWYSDDEAEFELKGTAVGVLSTENEDVRSLRELLIYGLKGIGAYTDHAAVLGHEDSSIYGFAMQALASTTRDLTVDEMVGMVMKAGETAVTAMALLDKANTESYGNPEITEVNIGVGSNPGILISGHDLKDMEALLKQTEGTGVDVYTHSEMLPANYYPAFKKYSHFVGNYGNAWWKQDKEFASFNGPILMTTNCIVPVKDAYKDRIFTTGMAGYPGVEHIKADASGTKNFTKLN